MKDIPGFEGLYASTEDGYIWRYNKKSTKKGGRPYKQNFLKGWINNEGYIAVHLYNNKQRKGYLGHRLIAITYIPNPENKPCINHKNGNRLDNRVENLEWCTSSENNLHTYRALGRTNKKKI